MILILRRDASPTRRRASPPEICHFHHRETLSPATVRGEICLSPQISFKPELGQIMFPSEYKQ